MAAIYQSIFSNASIILNENLYSSIAISSKFGPKGPINNINNIIGSDNGLAPIRRQTIIWTNDG